MPKTVLIVEDNERNLKLFSVIIGSLGYDVMSASDGQEGISAVGIKKPDLILMDIQKPKMDGITALGEIRKDRQNRGIPVVALTSYAMKGDRERLLAAGFVDYISKPINKDSFVEAVKKALCEPLAI